MKRIAGGTALVTGAGSEIGRASALQFTAEGANVVVADVATAEERETVELIDDAGGEATFVELDVSDTESVERMVDVAVEAYGSLEFAHNNAGILTDFVDVTGVSEERWNRIIDVNLKGVWACLTSSPR
jgi:NAD(P)-dependent dehydrogenase (short-subunit alcohol dehydrogenase family)